MIRIALLLLTLGSLGAHAAELGETVHSAMPMGDRQLPLPRGAWIIAGLGVQELAHGATGPFGAISSAVLIQRNGNRVTAIAEFNSNAIALSDGWDAPTACDQAAPELRLVRYRSRLDSACAFITDTPMTGGPPAWQQAMEFIAQQNLHLPDTMLTAAFIVSDPQDLVDARLHFDPVGFPRHDEAQHMLLAWAGRFAPEFEQGLANQLTGPPVDGPLRASLLSDTPALDQKLLALETLRQSGSITPADALSQEQAAQLEQPRSAEPPASDSWYYRLTTPLINLTTAYSVTQSAPLAVAIAVTEHVAHSVVSVANQAVWDRVATRATRHLTPAPALLHIGDVAQPRPAGPTS